MGMRPHAYIQYIMSKVLPSGHIAQFSNQTNIAKTPISDT